MKQQKSTFNYYNLFLDEIFLQNIVNVLLIEQILCFYTVKWARKNMLVKWEEIILSWECADKMTAVVYNQALTKTNAFKWFKRDPDSHCSVVRCFPFCSKQGAAIFNSLRIQIKQGKHKHEFCLPFLFFYSFKKVIFQESQLPVFCLLQTGYLLENTESISLWCHRKCIYFGSARQLTWSILC